MTKTEAEKALAALLGSIESNADNVREEASKKGSGPKDDRVLKLANGKTRGRVLPPLPGSNMVHPWVKKYMHYFQSASSGEKVWFDCPTSHGARCKICDKVKALYDEGTESAKAIARKYKRRPTWCVNLYVRDAENQPEINGTVKVYRFGIKVFEKMREAMDPALIGTFYNPSDAGADFTIIKKVVKDGSEEYANYDSSTFIKGVPLAKSAEEIMSILGKAYDLHEFEAQVPEDDPNLATAYKVHVLGEDPDAAPVAPVTRKVDPVSDQAKKPAQKATPAPKAEEEDDDDFMKKVSAELGAGNSDGNDNLPF